jgi:hypothetical protein
MRKAMRTLMAGGIVAAAVAMPAAAQEMAYCIRGCDFGGGAGDCSFSSLAQCQASAAGRNNATCVPNFSLNAKFNARAELSKAELPTDHNHLSRRKF